MRCNHCGSEIPDGSRFCRECGNRLYDTEETSSEWTYEESKSSDYKKSDDVVSNRKLEQAQGSQPQKTKQKPSKLWMWLVVFIIIAAIFPSKKSQSNQTSSTAAPGPTPSPTPIAAAEVSHTAADNSDPVEPKWYEAVPSAIDSASFSESTYVDGIDIFTYEIPNSWRKRHDPGSKWTFYYPFKNTNKTFVQFQISEIGFNTDSLSEEAYEAIWVSTINGVINGIEQSDNAKNVVATPCLVNGNRIAVIEGTFTNKGINGQTKFAVFLSNNKMLTVGALLADEKENLSLDDYYAILCSVKTVEPSLRDFIYPRTVETTFVLNAKEAPDAVFNSLASENGLEGNIYCLDGTVKEYSSFTDGGVEFQSFILATSKGDVIITDMYTPMISDLEAHPEELGDNYDAVHSIFAEPSADYSFPPIDSQVRVIGYYVGFSNTFNMPSFCYGYPNYIQANNMLGTSEESEISPTFAPTPTPMPTPTPTPKPTSKPTQTPTPTKKPELVDYSTNDKSTVKNGNSGIYAYKNHGGTYDNYWVIDFDNGYVYNFQKGNGNSLCDRVKIDSGDLNSVVIITYHDGSDKWQYGLHFKWARQPDHLILQDNDGFEYDFYTTNLENALTIRDTMRMVDY